MSSSTSTDAPEFSADELAEKLPAATVQVVLGFKETGPKDWSFKRVKLHGDLPAAFRSRGEYAAKEVRDVLAARPYDPEWELKSHEYFYVANDPPMGGNFFSRAGNLAGMLDFRPRKVARKPQVWVIISQLDDGSIAFLGAKIGPSAILDRNSKVLRVVSAGDTFDALDETVITFDGGIDWIAWRGLMVVLNAKGFLAAFRDIA